MAMAAILKKVNIAKAPTHCGHGFCNFFVAKYSSNSKIYEIENFCVLLQLPW
jgi:hypothetical protein